MNELQPRIEQAARWLAEARKTIVFTGAGVSTESGIPDFRSATGLWARYDPAEYATLGAFRTNPGKVWHMLAELEDLLGAQPNAGHTALAQLEQAGAVAGIVTQNIDGLHQAAGSRDVVEFHGSGRTYTCLTCGCSFPRAKVQAMPRASDAPLPIPTDCERRPQTAQGSAGGAPPPSAETPCVLKPDVVFFDELIPQSAQLGAMRLLHGADLVIVAGTSCEVFPAADIPWQVRRQGGRVIELNLEPAPALRADLVLQGPFSHTMSALHAAWVAQRGGIAEPIGARTP